MKLPSGRTLHDYTHYFKIQTEFQQEVNEKLSKEAKADTLSEQQAYCSLILGEMKIKVCPSLHVIVEGNSVSGKYITYSIYRSAVRVTENNHSFS